jgi:4-hydroxybenzoate polyprenyltransferase
MSSPSGASFEHDQAAPAAQTSVPGVARGLVRAARPRQWIKNGFVFVPAAFGGALLTHLGWIVLAAVAFSFAASGLYLINDVCDRESDRLHERTRRRPIASGQVSVPVAIVTAALLLVVGMGLAALVSWKTAAIVGTYVVLTLAYSFGLKRMVIVDVLLLAAGFVLRLWGGAAAANVQASTWLLLCMMFLALFLGFGKRRQDLLTLKEDAATHRAVLNEYTPAILNQFLVATMVSTMLSYALYVFTSVQAAAHRGLLLTIPFAVFGVFRYVLVAEVNAQGAAPEDLLLSDRPLQLAALAWIVITVLSLYVLPANL